MENSPPAEDGKQNGKAKKRRRVVDDEVGTFLDSRSPLLGSRPLKRVDDSKCAPNKLALFTTDTSVFHFDAALDAQSPCEYSQHFKFFGFRFTLGLYMQPLDEDDGRMWVVATLACKPKQEPGWFFDGDFEIVFGSATADTDESMRRDAGVRLAPDKHTWGPHRLICCEDLLRHPHYDGSRLIGHLVLTANHTCGDQRIGFLRTERKPNSGKYSMIPVSTSISGVVTPVPDASTKPKPSKPRRVLPTFQALPTFAESGDTSEVLTLGVERMRIRVRRNSLFRHMKLFEEFHSVVEIQSDAAVVFIVKDVSYNALSLFMMLTYSAWAMPTTLPEYATAFELAQKFKNDVVKEKCEKFLDEKFKSGEVGVLLRFGEEFSLGHIVQRALDCLDTVTKVYDVINGEHYKELSKELSLRVLQKVGDIAVSCS